MPTYKGATFKNTRIIPTIYLIYNLPIYSYNCNMDFIVFKLWR